jgi:thiol-disulfide isomerase/thioredoxin
MRFALVLALCALGCSKPAPPDTLAAPVPSASAPASAAAASGMAAAAGVVSPSMRHGLPWYEDAPAAALAAARAQGKLVLVDLWAPWCHTCLSMQDFVLTAENLPKVAERFVLLAVDTERESNAAFLEKLPVGVWPTFYVVDPEQKVLGRWLGAASAGQFVRFLAEGERAAALQGHATGAVNDPLALLVAGDEQATRGDFRAAAERYGEALGLAPADWPRRPDALVSRITTLSKSSQDQACAELGASAAAQTGASASAVDFAHYALSCAERAGDAALAARARRAVEPRLESLCERGSSELSPDDRADACDKLSDARTALGDEAGAKSALTQRLAVLEAAVQGKPSQAIAAYDWAFTDTLIELGRADQALARSLARERERPDDYNPPQHQARAYKALARYQEGLVAIDRALSLAYGPRKIGFMTLKADLLIGAGQKDAAKQVVTEQLAAYRALPAGQQQPAAEARVAKRLAEWQ